MQEKDQKYYSYFIPVLHAGILAADKALGISGHSIQSTQDDLQGCQRLLHLFLEGQNNSDGPLNSTNCIKWLSKMKIEKFPSKNMRCY